MDNKFEFEIVTPQGIFLHYAVGYISLPIFGGYIGLAPNHRPIIAAIMPGILKTKISSFNLNNLNQFDNAIFINRGFVDFRNNHCSVIVEEATDVTDLNEKEIDDHIKELKNKIKTERTSETQAKQREDLLIAQAKKSIIKDLSNM